MPKTMVSHATRLTCALLTAWAGCGTDLRSPDLTLTSVTTAKDGKPAVVCRVQKTTALKINGNGLTPLPVDTLADPQQHPQHLELPRIALIYSKLLDGSAATGATTTLDDNPAAAHVRWTSGQEMAFDTYPGVVPADADAGVSGGDLAAGLYDVRVQNPDGRSTTLPGSLAAIDAPVLKAVVPSAACSLVDVTFNINGAGFLKLSGTLPSVTFTRIDQSGAPVTVSAAAISGCTESLAAPAGASLALCTDLSVTLPRAQLLRGRYRVTVTNPASADCATVEDGAAAQVDVVNRPTLTDVQPRTICAGDNLTLTGSDIYAGGKATVAAVSSTSLKVNDAGTSAVAQFSGPLPIGGPFDVTLQNAPGCEATLPAVVRVVPGPSILFVDPPAVPSVVALQATVYATGITAGDKIVGIAIAPSGTNNYTDLTTTIDPQHPNRALINLPSGLAPGPYDVRLRDQTSCAALLKGALTVVAAPALTVSAVSPAYGSSALDTPVIISGSGFVSTPRAYLSRSGGGNGVFAQALSAVTFQGANSLSAVARSGLPAGQYDLLVVNPDGSFGLLSKAFTMTAADAPPPMVTSVAPSSFVTGVATSATLFGSGFRAPTLALSCFDANGIPVAGGTATVSSATATSISASLTTTGAYCMVGVTNPDGTSFDYSAVGVTNASLNLTGFKAGASLTTARRGLAAVAGRPTSVARFVYALGGDTGSDAAPLDTVEAAPTSLGGVLGSFRVVSQRLPRKLSFLGAATVGRFVYAVGGFDGTAARKEVSRAELLSPLAAPQVSDVDVVYDMTRGLDAGLYTYRVSAVLSDQDLSNPGGETLASDFFPVRLPTVSGKLQLVLQWSTVANATSYRVYRSVKANDAAGGELLLGTVAANAAPLQLIDDGSVTPSGAAALPLGSTGAWRALPVLSTARAGAGVTVVQDPANAAQWYLYAVGGNSGTLAAPAALSSIELLPITVAANGAQSFGSWTAATNGLPSARWNMPALTAASGNNSRIPANAAYLYIASGASGALGSLDKPIYQALVGAAGQPGAFASSGSVGVNRSGFGGALVNNQVIAFGGFQAGAASNSSDSAVLSSATALGNFNSLGGGALTAARALQGTALESAFIYQLGGTAAGVNSAQSSSEQTIW